ncbi:pentapeptide repeat-containing protein [Streptomyces mirabilis]|uniref:pentapeptide repeat-containing protein n=1 Tax=Streptomyces mirabilis TaxID=68239 RepID=UPI00369962E6
MRTLTVAGLGECVTPSSATPISSTPPCPVPAGRGLADVNLSDAFLDEADLTGTLLIASEFKKAVLRGADVTRVDFGQAVGMEADQLLFTKGTISIRLLSEYLRRTGRCAPSWRNRQRKTPDLVQRPTGVLSAPAHGRPPARESLRGGGLGGGLSR